MLASELFDGLSSSSFVGQLKIIGQSKEIF